jgi:hypothetical protein
MAKQWGKDFNQEAMAVLIPDRKASGGRVVIKMPNELSSLQWDHFFSELTHANKALVINKDDFIGVTTKNGNSVEFWFDSQISSNRGLVVFRRALLSMNMDVKITIEGGYYFGLLLRGRDY